MTEEGDFGPKEFKNYHCARWLPSEEKMPLGAPGWIRIEPRPELFLWICADCRQPEDVPPD